MTREAPRASDRLSLREATTDDAPAFRDYMTEPAYWRNLPIDPPTLTSIRAFLEQSVGDRARAPRDAWFLAAIETASGRLVGEGILNIRSRPWAHGEIGWGVDPARAGEGFATEIGAAMLRLAFADLGLHRVTARCRVEHAASRRIMAKLGMTEEGVLREDVCARGAWWSSVQGSILADEWRKLTDTLLQENSVNGGRDRD